MRSAKCGKSVCVHNGLDLMDCEDEGKLEGSTNRVTLNKNFAKNILKQVGDHNRIKSDTEIFNHRKFENDLRKKHTLKNLESFSSQTTQAHRTMYSDYYASKSSSSSKKAKKPHITPFKQVQKLISDAADFDKSMLEQQKDRVIVKKTLVSNRISLDKTLLHNHLKHTNVHNRLKEEEEMWNQHVLQKTRKVKSLQSKSSRERQRQIGSMYSDREVNKVKPLRIKSEYSTGGSFGKWTKQLLEEKDKDPIKWGHGGFQALYQDELMTIDISDQRTVNVSDDSDDEISVRKPVNGRRRIVKVSANSIGNGSSLKRSENIRSAKSIIMRTLENRTSSNGKAPKRKLSRGLHADEEGMEEKEEDNYRKVKRFVVKKPKNKWSHDRYEEVIDDEKKKKSKSVLVSDDSEDEKLTEKKGRKSYVVTKKSVAKVARGSVGDSTVNRVTLRNSIHEEVSEKPRKRLVLPKTKQTTTKKHGGTSETESSTESSGKAVDKKSKKRKTINRKRIVKRKRKQSATDDSSSSSSLSSSSNSDSSLTDSSTDEKRKKRKLRKSGRRRDKDTHKATFSDYDSDFQQRRH